MNQPEYPLTGQVALVTGANSGLGRALATALAAQGATLLMVCRNQDRGESARRTIGAATHNPNLHLLVADLASQADIRRLAAEVTDRWDRLHLLINNAGTAFASRQLSPDGIEMTLAVNHLAPFLLTNLLLDALHNGAPARIVNVGTRMDTAMDLDDLNWERRSYQMMKAYGQAKLGNLHFTFELARRLAGTGVTVNACFPGVFHSNLGGTDGAQGWFWKVLDTTIGWALPTPAGAAQRVLYLATDPAMAGVTGGYYGDRRPIPAPAQARDPEANRRVWTLSERLTGLAAT
jgi:retinol dehydrogenase 13